LAVVYKVNTSYYKTLVDFLTLSVYNAYMIKGNLMTVAELIAKLQTMDQTATVRMLNLYSGEYTPEIDIEYDPELFNGTTGVYLIPLPGPSVVATRST
jgi:hypothetical protein